MRVFLDANVLFSAAYMDSGSPRALFDLAAAGACTLNSTAYAIEEARRNITVKKVSRAASLDRMVAALSVCGPPSAAYLAWAAGLGLPAKDAPILAAAAQARCQVLVTGDITHFSALFGKQHRGVAVLRPADAIEMLVGG